MLKLDRLKYKRSQLMGALYRARTFLDSFEERSKAESSTSKFYQIKSRFDRLPIIFDQFEEAQTEVEFTTVTEHLAGEEVIRTEFENIYYSVNAKMQELMAGFRMSEPIADLFDSSPFLPPFTNLPKFNGDHREWLKFKNSYVASVHDNPSQKSSHLRSGSGEDIHETTSNTNVRNSASESLNDQYDRNMIARHFINLIQNFNVMREESPLELRDLQTCVKESLKALKEIGMNVGNWDLVLVSMVSSKLDPTTRKEWKELEKTQEEVSLQDLLAFITYKYELLERLDSPLASTSNSNRNTPREFQHVQPPFRQPSVPREIPRNRENIMQNCRICNGRHHVPECPSFLKLTPSVRLEVTEEIGLCLNCLRTSHTTTECSEPKCRKCDQVHHTLLHFDSSETESKDSTDESQDESIKVAATVCNFDKAVLPTAMLEIKGPDDRYYTCRALLDSGSMCNIITQELCMRMGLKTKKINLIVTGVGLDRENTKLITKVNLKSKTNPDLMFEVSCIVFDKLTSFLEKPVISLRNFKIPDGIPYADPDFEKPGSVDLLLGSTVFWELLERRRLSIPGTSLKIQETKLGWVIAGHFKKGITWSSRAQSPKEEPNPEGEPSDLADEKEPSDDRHQ